MLLSCAAISGALPRRASTCEEVVGPPGCPLTPDGRAYSTSLLSSGSIQCQDEVVAGFCFRPIGNEVL
jgi:hypothetical protein